MTVAELDGAVVECAARHFGLRLAGGAVSTVAALELPLGPVLPGHVRVVVGDGIDLVRRLAAAGASADAVLVDADAKDLSTGRSFPPPAFLAPPFLADVATLLQPRDGTAVFNVAARSRTLFEASIDAVHIGLGGPSTAGTTPAAASWEVCCASVDAEDLNSLVVATRQRSRPIDESDVQLPAAVRRWVSKWGALLDARATTDK